MKILAYSLVQSAQASIRAAEADVDGRLNVPISIVDFVCRRERSNNAGSGAGDLRIKATPP